MEIPIMIDERSRSIEQLASELNVLTQNYQTDLSLVRGQKDSKGNKKRDQEGRIKTNVTMWNEQTFSAELRKNRDALLALHRKLSDGFLEYEELCKRRPTLPKPSLHPDLVKAHAVYSALSAAISKMETVETMRVKATQPDTSPVGEVIYRHLKEKIPSE